MRYVERYNISNQGKGTEVSLNSLEVLTGDHVHYYTLQVIDFKPLTLDWSIITLHDNIIDTTTINNTRNELFCHGNKTTEELSPTKMLSFIMYSGDYI